MYKNLGKENSSPRRKQAQSLWGGNKRGVFKEQEETVWPEQGEWVEGDKGRAEELGRARSGRA